MGVTDYILYYQNSISENMESNSRLIYCLQKLEVAKDIEARHFKATNIDKIVLGLSKHGNPEVQRAAAVLLKMWEPIIKKTGHQNVLKVVDLKQTSRESRKLVEVEDLKQKIQPENHKKADQNGKERKSSKDDSRRHHSSKKSDDHKKKEEKSHKGDSRGRHEQKSSEKSSRKHQKDEKPKSSSASSHSDKTKSLKRSRSPSESQQNPSKARKIEDSNGFGNALLALDQLPKKETKRSSPPTVSKQSSRSPPLPMVSNKSLPAVVMPSVPVPSNRSPPLTTVSNRSPPLTAVPSNRSPPLATVSNRSPPVTRSPPQQDEDTVHFQSKHSRTKVFSGNKNRQIPKLFDMCTRVCRENLESLDYPEEIPSKLVHHLLEKSTPQQLTKIEYHNPSLMEKTGELWEAIVKKQFRGKVREEFESHREMYDRCTEEQSNKLKSLSATINKMKAKNESNLKRSKIVSTEPMHKNGRPQQSLAAFKKPSQGTAAKNPQNASEPSARVVGRVPPRKPAPMMAKLMKQCKR